MSIEVHIDWAGATPESGDKVRAGYAGVKGCEGEAG